VGEIGVSAAVNFRTLTTINWRLYCNQYIYETHHLSRRLPQELDRVQRGLSPDDVKPMPSIGKGVEEIRIWDEAGTFRVVYCARLVDSVYVLHAFKKTTQATSKRDIDLARTRFTLMKKGQP